MGFTRSLGYKELFPSPCGLGTNFEWGTALLPRGSRPSVRRVGSGSPGCIGCFIRPGRVFIACPRRRSCLRPHCGDTAPPDAICGRITPMRPDLSAAPVEPLDWPRRSMAEDPRPLTIAFLRRPRRWLGQCCRGWGTSGLDAGQRQGSRFWRWKHTILGPGPGPGLQSGTEPGFAKGCRQNCDRVVNCWKWGECGRWGHDGSAPAPRYDR